MRWLVDRYVPAYLSDRQAVEVVIRGNATYGAPNRWGKYRELSRTQRRTVLRQIVQAQRENRRTYYAVMTGRFSA